MGVGLVLGLLLLGAGNAAAQLTRYLAGDLFAPGQRGRAIALVVLGSTVGTQTLRYQEQACAGRIPSQGYPINSGSYDVIDINVTQP